MAELFQKNIKTRNLIIGIGNSGRQDDGLGWKFLDSIAAKAEGAFELIYAYQLNVEDAELISNADSVFFVDACFDEIKEGFEQIKCVPKNTYEFTTHALNPQVVLALCHELYGKFPDARIIKIQGYEWELNEGLSKKANENLLKAIQCFENKYLLMPEEI